MGRVRALIVAGAVLASVVGVMAVEAVTVAPAGAAPEVAPAFDPLDKTSVMTAYANSLVEARKVPSGWTGDAATCFLGSEPAASIDATRSAVNFYRALNKLAPVTMDATNSNKALYAALAMQANNQVNHFPPANWKCITPQGIEAAAASNLAQGVTGARAVDAYMEDAGAGNTSAGHRRWVLNPQATAFGTGSTTSYNALWVMGSSGARPGTPWVSWPSEGFVPKSLVKPLFSLSSNTYPDADYSAATVTVKIGATSLPVTVHPLEPGIGDNTLTWNVTLPAGFSSSLSDVKLDIAVAGIKTASGTALPTRSYSSTAFFAQLPDAPTGAMAVSGDKSATVSWTAPTFTGDSPITGYAITPYAGIVAQPTQTFSSTSTTQTATGLTNGTTYTFRVQTITAEGISAQSSPSGPVQVIPPPQTVPGAPTGAAATGGNAQARVTWTAPASDGGSPITGYSITPFRNGTPQTPVASSGTGTARTLTGLTNGASYTFAVAAVNAIGTGPLSGATNAVVPAVPTVAGAPTSVTATPGDGQALVSWVAPASNGGSSITGYSVTPYKDGIAQTPVVFSGIGTTKTVTGLTNGAAYSFAVAAVNGVGTGALSLQSAQVTPSAAPTVPGKPTGVSATAGNGEAALGWTAPSNGGSPITQYWITPYKDGNAQSVVISQGTDTFKLVTGLTNGSGYAFTVTAVNALGNGVASNLSTEVMPIGPPEAPTNVTATASSGGASVMWSAPVVTNGAPVTSYWITPYIDGVAQTPIASSGTQTFRGVSGLVNGTTYTFRVAAVNSAGTGPQSAASSPVTPLTLAGAPTGVTATAGDKQATVSWTAPASNGGAPITSYVIILSIGATEQPAVTSAGTGTSKVITGLTNGTAYTFKVAAVTAAGTGVRSAASSAVTPSTAVTVPGAPSAVGASPGDGQATVTWTAPGSNGGSAITGYVVTPYVGAVAQSPVTSSGTGTTKVITGLTNGTAYTFRVAAVNAIGTGASSAASDAVTPSAVPVVPGAPTGAAAVAGNAQATVSWTAPGSNGGSAITGYVVTPYVGAVAQTPVTSSGTGTSKVITGLTNGTAYTFKVAAVNAVGTGASSGASNAVTPAAPVLGYAPFTSWGALVNRLYTDLTTKAPSASASSSWVSQLSAGTKTKGELADSLRRGSENLANVDPVVRVYRAFLGRAPDAGGLQFWIKRKRNVAPAKTWSVTQIATEFTRSNEFVRKYGSLSNRAWVTQIYTDVLLRPSDPSGVDYWTRQLDLKRKTRAQVMVGFSESNEYRTKQAQNTDVAVAYIFLMGRVPTSQETDEWVTRQKAGTRHVDLLTELLNSAKYATRITG